MHDYYAIEKKVVVGVPTLQKRPISWEWCDMYGGLLMPLGTSTVKLRVGGQKIDEARNALCEEAIKLNAQWLLFIADDVIPPHDVFDLLSRHQEPLVTGLYWTKSPTHRQPYIWNDVLKGPFENWKYGEYFQVDWAGCDCLLISVEDVLKKMEPPWFSCDWRWTSENIRPAHLATEDLYFFTKARKSGIKVWCDTACTCAHQDRESGWTYGLDASMKQFQDYLNVFPKIKKKGYVADLGCGKWTPDLGDAVVKRFDIDPGNKPDIICDLRAIPEKDNTFDMVMSHHVLEHFTKQDVIAVLNEWVRILKIGGTLLITIPNFEMAVKDVLKSMDGEEVDLDYAMGMIYGYRSDVKLASKDDVQLHKWGYTKKDIKFILKKIKCLGEIVIEEKGFDSNYSLNVTAKKLKTHLGDTILEQWNEIGKREGYKLDTERVGTIEFEKSPKPKKQTGKKK
jgi:predicted SAM-dependent methyltransferase